jgi:hypothetical protein
MISGPPRAPLSPLPQVRALEDEQPGNKHSAAGDARSNVHRPARRLQACPPVVSELLCDRPMVESRWVRCVFVVAALVSSSSFASDPEATPLTGPWRVELAVTPVSAQLNGRFVDHLGTSGQVAVVLGPHLRVFAAGTWNWHSGESLFGRELVEKVRVESHSGSTLVGGGVQVGTEVVLSRSSFERFHFPHQFEVSFVSFAGALSTKAQLTPESARPDGSLSPATFADTGWRPTVGAGLGVRFEFLQRFSIRVDLRESFFSTRVQTVNGCSVDELGMLDGAPRGLPTSPAVRPGCRVDAFAEPDQTVPDPRSVASALVLARRPSVEWASLQALQVSFGVVF